MRTQNGLPDIVTHNYDPIRGRFQNICDLPRSEAELILQEIRKAHQSRLKANYLDRRFKVEEWLRSERHKLIGSTNRKTPIYFFVGDFADGKDPLRPKSLRMRLDTFPEDVVTFTYSDSMSCFENTNAGDEQSPPFPRKLFTLKSLKEAVQKWGMPTNFSSTQSGRQPFIEMQLWDDAPLLKVLPDSIVITKARFGWDAPKQDS
ncbi:MULTISPECIES: hypothetical protein [Thalassospira]|uniref:hypothetical protein n=1 Tax=Thalassospira TaxID=168934 RepID=UPI0008DCA0B2|nr:MULTISPECIES: hypothetical protein [Thalassospira]MAB34770.1 hypothetical protein [Thalassospira sp.]MDM7976603.1 hypothetical protein [Thalassospira xiamenensis]OHY97402.1 hypothetical protein BC440_22140 [Thalassospira sp. MIT1004]HBS25136.1 hypothetical protein [Thalassospira sp.]|tara:strand:+ start:85 stop:696 length:612 start_codon:yes stop_codon:yes gene_type:complete